VRLNGELHLRVMDRKGNFDMLERKGSLRHGVILECAT
jgi:hypothetical protein